MATMTAAVVRAATVVATAVSTVAVLVIVVVALDVRVIAEIVRKKRLDCCVASSADTAVELNACTCKCHLCTAANPAADQYRYILLCEKSRKRTVTATVRIHDRCGNDLTVLYCVDLELFSMSEVLKDLSVFVSNCYFHAFILLIINYMAFFKDTNDGDSLGMLIRTAC